MTAANSLSLILRRLDEIERKLDHVLEELTDPHCHRLFGAPWQSFQGRIEEGISPGGHLAAMNKSLAVDEQAPGRGRSD
jgi:hypothetical protein